MSPEHIQFVYFDLGNVLVSFDPDIACANVARQFGVDIEQARAVIYQSGLQDAYEHGQVSSEQFADAVRRELKRTIGQMPTQALLDATSDMFTPIESMVDIIQSVVDGGHRVGILSNTSHSHWDWIKRQNWSILTSAFEVEILSYEVGVMKPDPRIYQAAQTAAGVSPSSILFLDDRTENVAGAIACGWQASQCIGGPEAVEVLRQFGVLA
jgi:FMN phosphatase YigB (HAD superfamily)